MLATGTAALAQKLVNRKSTSGIAKSYNPPAQKKTSVNNKKSSSAKPNKSGSTKSRTDIPWQQIHDLYNNGLSVAEISDRLKLTRPKTKKEKENPYPYYLTVGYLGKLANGVEVNGKKLQIVRGSKNKKRAASKDK